MPYGLTSTGFVPKTLAIIREEMAQAFEDVGGASVGVRARSNADPLGHVVGTLAEREALLWELMELLVSVLDPDNATGARLDAICKITGTLRLAATFSTVTLTLTGDDAITVPLGSQVRVTPAGSSSFSVNHAAGFVDGAIFATDADALLTDQLAWAQSTAYVVGDLRYAPNQSWDQVYVCTVAGTSLGSGTGPTGTSEAEADNTVTWAFLGTGRAMAVVAATATVTGPITALAYALRTIETPVSGWTSSTNQADATIGTDQEADEALRIRRVLDLAAPGTSPVDSIRAALLAVLNVTSVSLFVNNSNATDGDGVPAKAVEALVIGGTDQAIFDALLANVAAGIETSGTESGTADDSEGTSHAMEFSRPTDVDVWIIVTLLKNPLAYTTDAAVETAIITWGALNSVGNDVRASAISAECFEVPGVLDVTEVLIGLSDPPTLSTTLSITTRQLAKYDSARITINSSDGPL